jgi:hypothetical protein
LHGEVEKAVKEMRDGKAAGNDDDPRDVLRLLGEDVIKVRQLINNIWNWRVAL